VNPLEYRPLDLADPVQVDAAARISIQSDLDSIGWTNETRESVLAQLTSPIAWPELHRLVWDGDVAVGLLAAELDLAGREVFVDAYAQGPRAAEIQRALVVQALEAARGRRDEVDQVMAAGWETEHAYFAVLADLGFRTVRRFWRMHLTLDGWPADEPAAPAGVSRRTVQGDEDRRLLHRLFEESFAEHFGSHARPFEEWIEGVESTEGVDPTRWWIAELDGEPVGLCILDDSKAEFGEGYVRTLGIVPAARGRGIARWLLACAAADAVRRGRTGLALAVDGENTTGATALYESVGFVIRQAIDVWRYGISDSDSSR
jgi:ribosomal protein S18 acetylase RimI-like enzyme